VAEPDEEFDAAAFLVMQHFCDIAEMYLIA
jgi:hypothetical protein